MMDEIGGFDESFPMYGEDIELQYRARCAGWERWYVPGATAAHDYQRVVDRTFLSRRTWWHLRGMAQYVRRHPETLLRL
jgi:GT2 family glycosyltransferase